MKQIDISKMTVLAIDDDPDTRSIVNGILSITYPMHDFIFVDNGFDALLVMKTHDPDIYLFSLDLPEVYLTVVTHEIKVLGKESHSIAMSSNKVDMTDKCLETGIKYHVPKPVNVNHLFAKVDEIIEGIFFGRMCRQYNKQTPVAKQVADKL